MKLHLVRFGFLPAVALLGAASLSLPAKLTRSESPEESVKLRIEVDRPVLPADSVEKAVIKVALDGLRPHRREMRPPVNVALVIDRSGSMSGDKIVKAREAAREAVRRLGPDDILSLVVYDNHIDTLVPAQRVGDGRRFEDAIHGIVARGGTALYGGVTCGAAEVRRNLEDRRFINRIILVSDGLANVGPSSPAELGRLGATLMREGISVTTIGLGLGYNEDLMTQLAQRSDGNTYFVEHSADLPRIFAAELGDVLSVIARRVIVEIEFPADVRPLAFIGREGMIRGQKAELALNQLYSGQEKFALIEVEVKPGKAGGNREIARARVNYEDPLTQKTEIVTAERTVTFSASRAEVVRSADHRVQTDYASNMLALAKEEAVTLVDSNRREDAAASMRKRADDLRRLGDTYGNTSVQELAAAAAPEADRVEREGLSNADRKIYRAEAAQTRSQQAVSK